MQQVLLPLCSQCCHHPLIRPGVTYFAWLVWASAIHRTGLSPKVSAAAFATHPWICANNFKPLNVTSYWTTSSQPTHSMAFWSEQEYLLSKKLLPPRLSLISSTFCSWFTVVKCPELVSCLCKTPFSFQWPAEKNQGGGILLLCSWTSGMGISPLFLLFQRLLFQVQGLCCEILESAVVVGLVKLGLWNPCNGSWGVTWLCVPQSMWHWVSVTSGCVEDDFWANICHMTQPTELFAPILFCFLMFCNWSIFVGICSSVWCVLSWWWQM